MELALIGALIIGLSLGLLGSGGSLLTVPVLVYILNRPEKEAVAESLAIVGMIALVGVIPYVLRKQIHWNSVFLFGLPGIVGSCIGGCCTYYISGSTQLMLFACLMIGVSALMIFGPVTYDQFRQYDQPKSLTMLEGFILGCITGFIGIGGGMIIVPALVVLTRLPMSFAVGTSLTIITMNSLVGFLEQLSVLKTLQLQIDWSVIGMITAAGMVGSLCGGLIGKSVSQGILRKVFGVSAMVLGLGMIF